MRNILRSSLYSLWMCGLITAPIACKSQTDRSSTRSNASQLPGSHSEDQLPEVRPASPHAPAKVAPQKDAPETPQLDDATAEKIRKQEAAKQESTKTAPMDARALQRFPANGSIATDHMRSSAFQLSVSERSLGLDMFRNVSGVFLQIEDITSTETFVTVGQDGRFTHVIHAGSTYGYVDISSGHFLYCDFYATGMEDVHWILDCERILDADGDNYYYSSGYRLKRNDTWYYPNGQIAKSSSGNYYYANGQIVHQNGRSYYPGGETARYSRTLYREADDSIFAEGNRAYGLDRETLRDGSYLYYPEGDLLATSSSVFDLAGYNLRNRNMSVKTYTNSNRSVRIEALPNADSTIVVQGDYEVRYVVGRKITQDYPLGVDRTDLAIVPISDRSFPLNRDSIDVAFTSNNPGLDNVQYSVSSDAGSEVEVTVEHTGPNTGKIIIDPNSSFDGDFVVTLTATDGQQSDQESFRVTVENAAPVVDAIANRTVSYKAGSLSVPFIANDPEGLSMQLAVTHSGAAGVNAQIDGSNINITLPSVYIGTTHFTLTANDGNRSTSQLFSVTGQNHHPSLPSMPDVYFSRNRPSMTLSLSAHDVDGDALTFSAISLRQEASLVEKFGLFIDSEVSRNNYFYNHRNKLEKYIKGANNTWFFLTPDGALYSWTGDIESSFIVARLDPSYYVNPVTLINSPSIPASVDLFVDDDQLTITPLPDQNGVFGVKVNVSDGSNTSTTLFFVSIINRAPKIQPIVNRTIPPQAGTTDIAFAASDEDGDDLQYTLRLYNEIAYLKNKYNIHPHAPFASKNWYLNHRGHSERYIAATEGNGYVYYYITPDLALRRWNGVILGSDPIEYVSQAVYENPALLTHGSTAPGVDGVTAEVVNGDTIRFETNRDFQGRVYVELEADDNFERDTKKFVVNVDNDQPMIEQVLEQTISFMTDSLTIPLIVSDTEGDTVNLTARTRDQYDNPGVVAGLFRFQTSSHAASHGYYYNSRGQQEKYIPAGVAGGNTWYFIKPNGYIYSFNWSGIEFSELVAKVDPKFFSDPGSLITSQFDGDPVLELIFNHRLRYTPAVRSAGYYENHRNHAEKYFHGGFYKDQVHWYFTKPDGSLHKWNGAILSSPKIGDLTPEHHIDLDRIFGAEADLSLGQDVNVATDLNGTDLELDPGASFVGTALVEVTANDGIEDSKMAFVLNVTNAAPEVADIADISLPSTDSPTTINVGGVDPDGLTLTYAVEITTAQEVAAAYNLQDQPVSTNNNYFRNYRKAGEVYLRTAANTWVFVLPNGDIHAWNSTLDNSPKIGNTGSYFNEKPWELFRTGVNASDISASFNADALTIDLEPAFEGAALVKVTVSDGHNAVEKRFGIDRTND